MGHTFYSTDMGEWPTNMNNEAKEPCIRKVSSICQHKDLSFEEYTVPRTDGESGLRTYSEGLFIRSHVSGTIVERDWLFFERPKGKPTVFIASYSEQVKIVL